MPQPFPTLQKPMSPPRNPNGGRPADNTCPCCGAAPGAPHDPDCALVAYLENTRSVGMVLDSEALAVPTPPLEKRRDAPMLLDAAAGHMRDRAATYDQPGGERSMGRTVSAFNVITGREQAYSSKYLISTVDEALRLLNAPADERHQAMVDKLTLLKSRIAEIKDAPITESEGWLLMQILKDVRDRQREKPHPDSLEDCIAYSALKAEARLAE
jgi:hypothetical protein